jgi:hypothetical protein
VSEILERKKKVVTQKGDFFGAMFMNYLHYFGV